MADESQSNAPIVLRSINWREVFPFTNIFRGFRIAVHPSKLVLGLLALLTLYIGGRALDWIWPWSSKVLPAEIMYFEKMSNETVEPSVDFSEGLKDEHKRARRKYAQILKQYEILDAKADAKAYEDAAESFSKRSEVASKIMWLRNGIELPAAGKALEESTKSAVDTRDAALKAAANIQDGKQKSEAESKANENYDAAIKRANDGYRAAVTAADEEVVKRMKEVEAVVPRGVFISFFEYQVTQVNEVAKAVWRNDWLAAGGVKDRVVNFFSVGPVWLWKHHTVFAVLFTVLFLLVWAVFGGAISRIAAVHVARDEKISVRQALRFSLNKVLSFVFAPVIPLIIIAVIGLLIAVGGLLLYIPVVGPIAVGAMFFLALIAAVVITLVLFGTIGGFSLMYPTIAVEGSDSFDAISRSFSYVFARPWRMVFYTAVAIGYGAFTYLFVRFFVWIVLLVTHSFASLFLREKTPGQGTGYWFTKMWPEPGAFWSMKLPYDVNYAGLAWSESLAALLISIWVYLLIALVGAYAISYFLSVSTIIYTLMRREVDATELEDVYVEEMEDDLGETVPAAATPAPVAAPATAPSSTSPATIMGTVPESKPQDGV
jgi:hypothetical protein